jgi:hypothetical protein
MVSVADVRRNGPLQEADLEEALKTLRDHEDSQEQEEKFASDTG